MPPETKAVANVSDDATEYEIRTVKALRGTESRAAAKWEQDGWEVVSQTAGLLQTELTIRRPKPKSIPQRYLILGGAVIAIVAVAAIVIGSITEDPEPNDDGSVSSSEDDSVDAPQPSPSPPGVTAPEDPAPINPEPQVSAEDEVVSVANNADLAAIIGLGDYCDPSIAAFAEKYRDRPIILDASIGAINSHDGAATRYDILLGAGDFSENSATGPAFQFRDVNTTSDLNFIGDPPETIGVGSNLSITAQVDRYDPQSCLFLLDPVATAAR